MQTVWYKTLSESSSKGPKGWPIQVLQQRDKPEGDDWIETTPEGYEDYCRALRAVYLEWETRKIIDDNRGVMEQKAAKPVAEIKEAAKEPVKVSPVKEDSKLDPKKVKKK